MSKIIKSNALSVDKLCTHRIEVHVEFDEPTSFFEAEEMVSEALGDYFCKMKTLMYTISTIPREYFRLDKTRKNDVDLIIKKLYESQNGHTN